MDTTEASTKRYQGGDFAHRYRWYILVVLVASLLVVVLDNSILNVALQTLASPKPVGLGASQSQLQWAVDAYTLVFGGAILGSGILGDRVGRKRVLLLGMVLFGVFSLASAYAHDPAQLIVFRGAMGLAGALVVPATLASVVSVFPAGERARAVSIWATGLGLGIAAGPVTGGALISRFWWGSVFLVNVPVVALTVIAIILWVPESRDPDAAGVDYIGIAMSVVGLVLVTYGIIKGGEGVGWTSGAVLGPLEAGVIVLQVFVWHQYRSRRPALDLRYFRNAAFTVAVAANAFVYFSLVGVTFITVFYLQDARGYSALFTGVCFLPLAAGQIVTTTRVSGLMDRFGARRVCATGLLLTCVSFNGYLVFGDRSPLWIVLLDFFVEGVGMALAMTAATVTVMAALPAEKAGIGSAVNNAFRHVGGSLGVAVLGSILATVYRGDIGPAVAMLPAGVRHTAGQSIAATAAVAAHLGRPGAQLITPAKHAFIHGMHAACVVSVCVALIGALAVLRLFPDGARPRASGHGAPKVLRCSAEANSGFHHVD
jgi:EmrB/QacA subfamily drug resistance transporter